MPLLVILFLCCLGQLSFNNGHHIVGNIFIALAAIYTALVIAEVVGWEQ